MFDAKIYQIPKVYFFHYYYRTKSTAQNEMYNILKAESFI